MSVRDLSLAVRAEDVREARRIPVPVHFSREQIKNHFNESIEAVKEQFDVAESLFQSDNKEGGQNDMAFSDCFSRRTFGFLSA